MTALAAGFDLIVSNPPYVPRVTRTCPRRPALRALGRPGRARDGLAALRTIIAGARASRRRRLAVEHGFAQSEAVQELLRDAGFAEITVRRDLAGIARVAAGACLDGYLQTMPGDPNVQRQDLRRRLARKLEARVRVIADDVDVARARLPNVQHDARIGIVRHEVGHLGRRSVEHADRDWRRGRGDRRRRAWRVDRRRARETDHPAGIAAGVCVVDSCAGQSTFQSAAVRTINISMQRQRLIACPSGRHAELLRPRLQRRHDAREQRDAVRLLVAIALHPVFTGQAHGSPPGRGVAL